MDTEKQLALLKEFLGGGSLSSPLTIDGYAVAANEFCAIAIPSAEKYENEVSEHILTTLKTFLFLKQSEEEVLPLKIFEDAFSKVPQVKKMIPTGVEDICDACIGDGMVEYVFTHNRQDYEIEEDCPVCDGTGKSGKSVMVESNEMVPDESYCFRFKDLVFQYYLIKNVHTVADLLSAKEVILIGGIDEGRPLTLRIGECLVVIMPCLFDDETKIIKIK